MLYIVFAISVVGCFFWLDSFKKKDQLSIASKMTRDIIFKSNTMKNNLSEGRHYEIQKNLNDIIYNLKLLNDFLKQ